MQVNSPPSERSGLVVRRGVQQQFGFFGVERGWGDAYFDMRAEKRAPRLIGHRWGPDVLEISLEKQREGKKTGQEFPRKHVAGWKKVCEKT